MKTPYLFSFIYWFDSPPKYILVYAENEEEARKIGSENCIYNSGKIAEPKDLELCTHGI